MVVQMLETQQRRQEELAAAQKTQMDTLTSRLEQQQQRVARQQGETEERVDHLQTNLDSLKAVFNDRLTAAEDRLGEMQLLQDEAQAKQIHQLQELHESVLKILPGSHSGGMEPPIGAGDYGKEAATAVLTPKSGAGAAATPHAIPPPVLDGEEVGGADVTATGTQKPLHRPAPFDGKSSWEAYSTQFELLSDLNHWSQTEKAVYLAVSLRGPALTVLTNLPAGQRRDYSALTRALQNRFGTGHQRELNRTKLRARFRHRDESLPALAEDVERLARLAYPDADDPMVLMLAKDQFIDALQDDDWKLRIRQLQPQTLQQALETALEMESYQLAGRQGSRSVRGAQVESRRRHQSSSERGDSAYSEVLQKLQECMGAFQQSLKSGASPSRRSGGTRSERRAKATCWNCKEKGHYRWECPKPASGAGSQDPQQQQVSPDQETPTAQQPSGNEQ